MSGGDIERKSPREARKDSKCPIRGKPAIEEHLPFCSKRCAQVDLNRWLSGVYAISGARQSDGDDGENGD